ncbi:helix-turn-helix domain-containing protein [Streptomyces prasinus]
MKLLREVVGLTQAQLGGQVGYGEAQIAAVEQGRRIPKPELIDAVDRAVGARGVLMAMKGGGGEGSVSGVLPARVDWRPGRAGRTAARTLSVRTAGAPPASAPPPRAASTRARPGPS